MNRFVTDQMSSQIIALTEVTSKETSGGMQECSGKREKNARTSEGIRSTNAFSMFDNNRRNWPSAIGSSCSRIRFFEGNHDRITHRRSKEQKKKKHAFHAVVNIK